MSKLRPGKKARKVHVVTTSYVYVGKYTSWTENVGHDSPHLMKGIDNVTGLLFRSIKMRGFVPNNKANKGILVISLS